MVLTYSRVPGSTTRAVLVKKAQRHCIEMVTLETRAFSSHNYQASGEDRSSVKGQLSHVSASARS